MANGKWCFNRQTNEAIIGKTHTQTLCFFAYKREIPFWKTQLQTGTRVFQLHGYFKSGMSRAETDFFSQVKKCTFCYLGTPFEFKNLQDLYTFFN